MRLCLNCTAVAAALLALTHTHCATAQDLGFTYLEADYLFAQLDRTANTTADRDTHGIALQAAIAYSEHVHAYTEYVETDLASAASTFELGLGLSHSVAPYVEVLGRAAFASADTTPLNDSGFALQAGMRGVIGMRYQLEGLVHYRDLDTSGSTTALRATGRMFFSPALAMNAGAHLDSHATTWLVGLRYSFIR